MEDRWITDWDPSPRWPHYTRANAGEVLPAPASPLGWTYTFEHGICLGWRDGYVRQGLYEMDEWDAARPEVCGTFGGYFYINLSNVRMQGVRNPAVTVDQLDLAFFGDHPDVPPYTQHPDDEKPHLVPRIEAHTGWVVTATEWPEILQDRDDVARLRAERPDLPELTDDELLARAKTIQPSLIHLFDQHTVTSSSSGIAPGILFAVGQAIDDPTIPMKILAGIGDVDSAEPSYALWDLSRLDPDSDEFAEGFERFLYEHGSRGLNEWELMAETWETDPSLATAMLDRIRLQSDDESPRLRHAAQAAEREATTAEVRDKVAGNEDLAGMVEAAINAGNMMAWRERTKTNIVRAIHESRMVFRELGRRHLPNKDVFMLLDDELEAFVADPASFRDTLAARASDFAELADLEPPFIIADGNVPPLSEWPRRGDSTAAQAAPGDVLVGVPGCPGQVEGTARVVLDPSDPSALEPGDILVAPLTDPSWTPLFMAAGGVVVNVGGQISHAIIVSRELGLPCVVSVTDATERIPDGAMVRVDGSTGEVTIL